MINEIQLWLAIFGVTVFTVIVNLIWLWAVYQFAVFVVTRVLKWIDVRRIRQ